MSQNLDYTAIVRLLFPLRLPCLLCICCTETRKAGARRLNMDIDPAQRWQEIRFSLFATGDGAHERGFNEGETPRLGVSLR